MKNVTNWLIVAPLLTLIGCAASGARATQTNSTVLTREEIATINVGNLYDAVQRLRPRWLVVRADRSFNNQTAIVVYEGQTLLGGPNALRDINVTSIDRLQYIDGPRASATLPGLGSQHVQGAIVIQMRRN